MLKGGYLSARTPFRRGTALGLVLLFLLAALPAAGALLAAGPATPARADEVTISQNGLRTGWDPAEPGLSPAVLRSGTFRRLFSTRVSGQVYAQPLVAGGIVVAATENDWVYGIDALTGRVHWHVRLGRPFDTSADGCTDLAPHVGVTGTPVYDPANGTVYAVAETARSGGANAAFHLFGINAVTGHVTSVILIHGRASNDHRVRFSAFDQFQRPGLLLMNGWIYAAFGSHCDQSPYDGYVASINPTTRRVALWSDETGLTDQMAGIWQGGGGVMSDGPGRIFVATGNGVSPGPGPGDAPPGQLAESVIRLAVAGNGTLTAQDFFSPQDAPHLDAGDIDFGSGGPVGLPFGSRRYPDLLVQSGKDGQIFLLNRNHLGGRHLSSNAAVSLAGPYGAQYGHPAAFGDTATVTAGNSRRAHDYVYYLGRTDNLRWLKLAVHGHRPVLTDVANSAFRFGYSSGSPVVSSNGTNPASAVVWVVGVDGKTGAGGTLDAFPGVPPAGCHSQCSLHTIWSAAIGRATKFTVPATDNGRVYVGTRGRVFGFGSTRAAPLATSGQVSFGQATVGAAARRTVTATALARVTVTGVTVSSATTPDPFSAGPVTKTTARGGHPTVVRLPVVLSRGDRLQVPMRFTPRSPGGVTGSLSFATRSRFGPVAVPLVGNGIRAGLYASPAALVFTFSTSGEPSGAVPIGTPAVQTTDLTNSGSTTQTVTSVTGPSGPFTASGLPTPGTRIQPGGSIVVEVTFAPGQPGPASSSITVAGSSGTIAAVTMSGSGRAAQSAMTVSPRRLRFGRVAPGKRAVATLTLFNAGNLPATIEQSTRLAAPYGTIYGIPAGLPLSPGYRLNILVSFVPRHRGAFAASYRIVWADRLGTHSLAVPLTGTGT
ncbi:MAG TPA: choice-of-anchor D domain-containing protein [Streptosporangiaceae bacterium]